MVRKGASEPPSDVCLTCDAWRGWRSIMAWARILIPVAIGLLVAAGGAAATSLVRDADTRSSVRALETSRTEASQDRQRLAAHDAEAGAERAREVQRQADRWRDVAASLARIETKIETLEARPLPRRRDR